MVLTCFLQAPFSFSWFLHVSYRPPFFIYMVYTCFLQGPFFHFYGLYMFHTRAPFFIYMVFFFIQVPFFHFYAWFSDVSYRPPFSFTCILIISYSSPIFHFHGFHMFYTGPLFSFTCFIQAPFFHFHGFYIFHTGPLFISMVLQGYKDNISRLFIAFG